MSGELGSSVLNLFIFAVTIKSALFSVSELDGFLFSGIFRLII